MLPLHKELHWRWNIKGDVCAIGGQQGQLIYKELRDWRLWETHEGNVFVTLETGRMLKYGVSRCEKTNVRQQKTWNTNIMGLDTIKLERWRSHGNVHKIRKRIQKWAKDDNNIG